MGIDSYLLVLVCMAERAKGNVYTFRGSTSVKIVSFHSGKDYTLKGTNLLPMGAYSFFLECTGREHILSFKSRSLFRKGLLL